MPSDEKVVTVRMPDLVHGLLREYTTHLGVSMNGFCVGLIKSAIEGELTRSGCTVGVQVLMSMEEYEQWLQSDKISEENCETVLEAVA